MISTYLCAAADCDAGDRHRVEIIACLAKKSDIPYKAAPYRVEVLQNKRVIVES